MFTFAPLVVTLPRDEALAMVRVVAVPLGGVSIMLVRLTLMVPDNV